MLYQYAIKTMNIKNIRYLKVIKKKGENKKKMEKHKREYLDFLDTIKKENIFYSKKDEIFLNFY